MKPYILPYFLWTDEGSPRRRYSSNGCVHGYDLTNLGKGGGSFCPFCTAHVSESKSSRSPFMKSSSRPKLWRRNTHYFTRSKPA